MDSDILDVNDETRAALADGAPVVALETTIVSHGLPWPANLRCALDLQTAVRAEGAVPATLGLIGGRIKIGLSDAELEHFATAATIAKVSRRDLAQQLAAGRDGATTVAATMICARLAGIKLFATGGIGGVHRGAELSFDVSADLTELARTPVNVVCAGAKSILDLAKTLEVLETYGVPVIGYGCDELPAFYCRSAGLALSDRVDSPRDAARVIALRERLGLDGGAVFAVPIPDAEALPPDQVNGWIEQALEEAAAARVSGKATTPFLLRRITELSDGLALRANLALVENNARAAARIAAALAAP